MRKLSLLSGNPHLQFPSLHIAGTNGKGSVSTKLAKALSSKYRVGLYTSPHIHKINERIQINGECIQDEEIHSFLHQFDQFPEDLIEEAHFFDCLTLMAFSHFAKKSVDIAVVEVGLGGEYDSTNILKPIASAITSIGLDHREILGDSLEEITKAKVRIAKEETPLVLGSGIDMTTVLKFLQPASVPLYPLRSGGTAEEKNQAVATALLKLIETSFPLNEDQIQHGLQSKAPFRFDLRKIGEQEVLFDLAHNPDALRQFAVDFRLMYSTNSPAILFGMRRNKELNSALKELLPLHPQLYFVQPDSHCYSVEELSKSALSVGFSPQNLQHLPTFEVLKSLPFIVVLGSFSTVDYVYKLLTSKNLDNIDKKRSHSLR